jgi:hypothetical protein
MIKHELIKKGGIGHALITSSTYPNILIPVKVVIKDVKFDENNPQYLVKIIKFYDNTHFIKTYFMNMPFKNKLDRRSRIIEFDSEFKPKTTEEIINHMAIKEHKYFVVVDSISCTRFKNDMQEMYNKIQTYLIERDIDSIKDRCTRAYYSGSYSMPTKNEFFARLKRMVVDLVSKTDKEWNEYINRF